MLVHLQSIDGVVSERARHAKEQFAPVQRAVGVHRIPVHDLLLIPVADVEEFHVGRICKAVGPGKICAHQLDFATPDQKHAGMGRLRARIIMVLRQAKRRVGKE
jgi:hypothetical protein